MTKPKAEERLLTAPEVCVRIGRSTCTLYAMIRQGVLPPARQIGARHSAWLESEITQALRRLPRRVGRPRKSKAKPMAATNCQILGKGGKTHANPES